MAITLATLMMTCAPLIHPTTLRALIAVESGGNPFAVSINYPQALKSAGIDPPVVVQPRSARVALDLTRELMARGFSTSVGLAQINIENVMGRDHRLSDLFDPCINLSLAQRVLVDCAAHQPEGIAPSARLRRTLLCYNAGEGVTGVHNHYASDVLRAALGQVKRATQRMRGPL